MSMRDFQERKKIERIWFSWPVLAILIFLVVLTTSSVFKVWREYSQLSSENDALVKKLEETQKVRLDNEKRFEILGTDYGIDREARARFNMKKRGEELVFFVGDGIDHSLDNKNNGWLSTILNWFK